MTLVDRLLKAACEGDSFAIELIAELLCCVRITDLTDMQVDLLSNFTSRH